jgi:hypothetical protein
MTNDGMSTRFMRRRMSRRNLVHGTVGAAGAVLGSGLWTPARADDDERDEHAGPCSQALPQVHTTAGPFGPLHFYFPGPIDGSPAPTDGTGAHPEGRDPSTITNFSGTVGQVDLTFGGTAIDTKTGARASYQFHTDTRFMKGQFLASDEQMHSGAFAFI